jgi:enoyl-CoA hydratase/carnithine racemase
MRANPHQDYYEALFARCSQVMQSIVNLPVPVIARVHGMATAAGCQIVASCDLAVASESATFAVSGINVGLFCSTPAVALSRNVSCKRAFDMLITGRFIPAAEALSYGLISRMASDAGLDEAVASLTSEICSKSPVAVRTGKAMFNRQHVMSLADAYAYAGNVMACNMMAEDVAEGIDAFIGKRRPVWKGC